MSWLLTSGARKFDLRNPRAQDVDPHEIAHSLGNLCRFTGHTFTHYSVAQHCLLVADLVPAEHRLAGLLHDAHEAYIGDISTPFKELLPGFREVEAPIWAAVADYFGIDRQLPPEVKHADRVALATEKRDLLPGHPEPWETLHGIEPAPRAVLPLAADLARHLWLDRLHNYLAHRRRAS